MTESVRLTELRYRLEVYRKRAVKMNWPAPRDYLRDSFEFADVSRNTTCREQVFKEKFVIWGPDFEEVHYRWLTAADMEFERYRREA